MSEFFSALFASVLTLSVNYLLSRVKRGRAARYLAIRVVCIFDKYLEDCVSVVWDNGDEASDGCLEPKVRAPGPPSLPNDVDWKSIDHNLMYEILSFPSDVEAADRDIAFTWDNMAFPPNYEEAFTERAFYYAQFGLRAYELAKKIRKIYRIPSKHYEDWNPVSVLERRLQEIKKSRTR